MNELKLELTSNYSKFMKVAEAAYYDEVNNINNTPYGVWYGLTHIKHQDNYL